MMASFITTSKEYLINSYILLKYFELVFLDIKFMQIDHRSTELLRNKKGAFLWNTM